MAHIQSNSAISVLKINQFLGLHENPDGETNLKTGELAELRNFRITADRHLQIRPGTKTILTLESAAENPRLCGTWTGRAGEKEHFLAAFGGAVYAVDAENQTARKVGECTEDDTSFFPFEGKVYLLNGHEFLSWDGGDDTEFVPVEPYVPTIRTASTPNGGGAALENVNRLTNLRKVEFSPDGTATVFYLPEQEIQEVTAVSGTDITWTQDAAAGTITFASAPQNGVNTVTVTYAKGDGAAAEVTGMRYAELFNGAQDTRVFLYGDGSNKTIYSGMNRITGKPTATYFPDLYEASIGDENTPITALVRHYARLLVFKTDSTWSLQYDLTTLATGGITAAFYVSPVNRQIGNVAAGQVRLLENSPLSLWGRAVYQWKATATGGNITADMRNANRISDRVTDSLSTFDFSKVKTFNRPEEREFWFLYGGKALILNYAVDAWYFYDGLPFERMAEFGGKAYGLSEDGKIVHISRAYRNDDTEPIDAYAETGAMSFDKTWLVKYSPMLFVTIKPESGARVTVTAKSDRRSDYAEKVVAYGISTFQNADFAHWSFGVNRRPQVQRVKMKVKKAAFYTLIFKSLSASAAATVLEADLQVRYGGNVK